MTDPSDRWADCGSSLDPLEDTLYLWRFVGLGHIMSAESHEHGGPTAAGRVRRYLARWRSDARALRTEVVALYLASRDPRTPWYAKVLLALVIGYAMSPIDLIPDFIPVLGYVDDLVLVPAGVAAVRKLIPPEVVTECRAKARSGTAFTARQKWIGVAIIVGVWLLVLYLVLAFLARVFP